MGTTTFNKEFVYAAEKLKFASNMADTIQLDTLKELVPILVLEQALLDKQVTENLIKATCTR